MFALHAVEGRIVEIKVAYSSKRVVFTHAHARLLPGGGRVH